MKGICQDTLRRCATAQLSTAALQPLNPSEQSPARKELKKIERVQGDAAFQVRAQSALLPFLSTDTFRFRTNSHRGSYTEGSTVSARGQRGLSTYHGGEGKERGGEKDYQLRRRGTIYSNGSRATGRRRLFCIIHCEYSTTASLHEKCAQLKLENW